MVEIPSSRVQDLTGRVFGKLTVIEFDKLDERKFAWWKCQCECGNIKSIRGSRLVAGTTTSCGCVRDCLHRNYNGYLLHYPDGTCERLFDVVRYCNYKLYRSDELMHIDMSNADYVIGETVNKQTFLIDTDTLFELADYYISVCSVNKRVTFWFDGRNVILSRYIFGEPEGLVVDHINGDSLDNRKTNLRIVTPAQNNMNRGLMSNNRTGVPGVDRYMDRYWRARIGVNGKDVYLGYFDNKDDAIKARYEAEEKYFGKYSLRNSRELK